MESFIVRSWDCGGFYCNMWGKVSINGAIQGFCKSKSDLKSLKGCWKANIFFKKLSNIPKGIKCNAPSINTPSDTHFWKKNLRFRLIFCLQISRPTLSSRSQTQASPFPFASKPVNHRALWSTDYFWKSLSLKKFTTSNFSVTDIQKNLITIITKHKTFSLWFPHKSISGLIIIYRIFFRDNFLFFPCNFEFSNYVSQTKNLIFWLPFLWKIIFLENSQKKICWRRNEHIKKFFNFHVMFVNSIRRRMSFHILRAEKGNL